VSDRLLMLLLHCDGNSIHAGCSIFGMNVRDDSGIVDPFVDLFSKWHLHFGAVSSPTAL